MSQVSTDKPKEFSSFLDIRFGDLDSYGHLNASVYLDLVISSRFIHLEKVEGVSLGKLVEGGTGFFVTHVDMTYKRPVVGTCRVYIKSHVSDVQGPMLKIPFEVRSENEEVLHCSGHLDCAVIDMSTKKPKNLPDDVHGMFFNIS